MKLSLTRETLKQLSADQAQRLAAGLLPTRTDACPDPLTNTCLKFCRDSFINCWQSECYSACCPTTQTIADCQTLA